MNSDKALDQIDYSYLTLMSLGNLTERSDKIEFSIDEISENMDSGKSKNRILFSLVDLISEKFVRSSDNDFNYEEIDEDLNNLKSAMDHDYFLTRSGIEEYDTHIKNRIKEEKVKSEQISPDLEILIYIYRNMIGFLFSYPKINEIKMSDDQRDSFEHLQKQGLIEAVRSKSRWKITASGKEYLENEAKL
ncbi:hypothetical protein AiwAL_09480 [Acidiphilium sp. AL]|uniref:Uncharacterized protein n=1 Tax=Acidiphilium iwatense TaxID=768198 RepID=A0ABS9DW66_9PROT|nr:MULTISPECIES: hypothetical protein [Acidiphilium]MCF3946982.1 hypothetical protein [Acidiphilium iwatense]MCU4160342.1 hypothetical protein [Acidiphilium sp. AL]